MGRKRMLRGGEKDGQHDIEAREHTARKIDPKARFRNALQQRVFFAVEYGSDPARPEKHTGIDRRGQKEHGHERIAQIDPHPALLSRSVRAAHQRLHALGDAGVNGNHHKRQIGDHAVSRHAGVSLQPEDHRVEYDDDDPGGHLRDQGGQAGGKDMPRLPQPAAMEKSLQRKSSRRNGPQPEPVPFFQEKRGQNAHADDGRESRRQHRAEDPHAKRKHENIVQHHVGKASSDHGGHGALRRAVVSHKAQKQVVQHEHGRKQQDHLQINAAHLIDRTVRPQKPDQRPRRGQTQQEENSRDRSRQKNGRRKGLIRRPVILLSLQDGIPGSSAHPDHQPASVDEIINRDRQVQRGQPVGAQRL